MSRNRLYCIIYLAHQIGKISTEFFFKRMAYLYLRSQTVILHNFYLNFTHSLDHLYLKTNIKTTGKVRLSFKSNIILNQLNFSLKMFVKIEYKIMFFISNQRNAFLFYFFFIKRMESSLPS